MREYTQYYKDGKPCYKGFTVYGCGTSTFYKEINKEEYDRLSAMSYGKVDKEIKTIYLIQLYMDTVIMDMIYFKKMGCIL